MDGSMMENPMRAEKMAALRAMERDRDGGLPQRQEELQSALGGLGQLLEELEHRLQPVLRDPEPQSDTLHGTPRLPESPLSGFLRGAASHAQDLCTRLQELTRRVDL